MTREEAIAVLRREIEPSVYEDEKSIAESIDMAIEALSAEPHNKDAISREGLLRSWEELSPRGRLEFDQVIMTIPALPSAEPKGDLISRRWLLDLYGDYIGDNGDPKYHVPLEVVRQNIIDAPSAEAESDDLIIKGAKGIKDGLYNITDGKLFEYKAKGGTVRTYPIVPSADAVHGEWVDWLGNGNEWECSVCKCSIESHGSICGRGGAV